MDRANAMAPRRPANHTLVRGTDDLGREQRKRNAKDRQKNDQGELLKKKQNVQQVQNVQARAKEYIEYKRGKLNGNHEKQRQGQGRMHKVISDCTDLRSQGKSRQATVCMSLVSNGRRG